MHELSIAQNIIEIVTHNVPAGDLEKVRAIRMTIGQLAGVVSDSLRFSFTAIASETNLKNASLEIKEIPFVIHCNECDADSKSEMGFMFCPECGGRDTAVVSGTEMDISEVELEGNSCEVVTVSKENE